MKAYKLVAVCPYYYGDEELIGIYTSEEMLNKAKEIKIRCSRIVNYARRLRVEELELDEMPYDSDWEKTK